MCRKGRVLPGLFLFSARFDDGREGGRDVVQTTGREAGQAAGLPAVNMEKTEGTALCRRCRYKLPAHMRLPPEGIVKREETVVERALRAAANYFEVHFKTIRHFGGGRIR
jgi:hypothetical protein